MKIIGLKTTSNIQTLIRDLFHSPPSFKSIVRLSWVQPKTKNQIKLTPAATATEKNGDEKKETAAPVKRHAPITFDNGDGDSTPRPAKQARKNNSNGNGQQMYSPPGGKFSSRFGKGGERGGKKFGGNRQNNRSFGGGNKQGGGRKKFGGGGRGGGGRKFRSY